MIPFETPIATQPTTLMPPSVTTSTDEAKFSVAWQSAGEVLIQPGELKVEITPEEDALVIPDVPLVETKEEGSENDKTAETVGPVDGVRKDFSQGETAPTEKAENLANAKLGSIAPNEADTSVPEPLKTSAGPQTLIPRGVQNATLEHQPKTPNPPSVVTAAMVNLEESRPKEGRSAVETLVNQTGRGDSARLQSRGVDQKTNALSSQKDSTILALSERSSQSAAPPKELSRAPVARDASLTMPLPTQAAQTTPPSPVVAHLAHQMTTLERETRFIDEPALVSGTGTGTTAGTRPATPHPLQHHAPHVAQQIAIALVQSKGGKTEIVLNPEELGKVRIALHAVEKGMSVSIMSERPETAELMRRNVEILAREFMDLGYETVSFSFDNPSGESGGGSDQSNRSDQPSDSLTIETPSSETHTNIAVLIGLDLKL